MRYFALLLTTSILIMLSSCGKSEREFDKNLNKAWEEMGKTASASAETCSEIASTWSEAILKNRTPSGAYCSDFNEAIKELFETYVETGVMDSIRHYNNEMQKYTSLLKDPPRSRKDCYDDFVEIVSEVSSFSRMATNPSGSLAMYNTQTNETAESIAKKIDQFNIKYGTFTE